MSHTVLRLSGLELAGRRGCADSLTCGPETYAGRFGVGPPAPIGSAGPQPLDFRAGALQTRSQVQHESAGGGGGGAPAFPSAARRVSGPTCSGGHSRDRLFPGPISVLGVGGALHSRVFSPFCDRAGSRWPLEDGPGRGSPGRAGGGVPGREARGR